MTPLENRQDAWSLAHKRVGHMGGSYTDGRQLFENAAKLYDAWAKDSRNTPNGENDAIAQFQEMRAAEFRRFAEAEA